jgi:hypothetical protein
MQNSQFEAHRRIAEMGDLKDGRYGFKINAKNAVVEIYMVKGELYFDLFLDGGLLVKEGKAKPGEDRETLLNRLGRVLEKSSC